jgi:CO/xanthine dehydrogenase FAD-binding subunit
MPPRDDPAMTDYFRPATLDEAVAVLARDAPTVLAGGTDLYAATPRGGLGGPVLDVTGIAEFGDVAEDAAGLRIGAAVTWGRIARAALPPALDALRQAAVEVGGRQVQAAGTIAGNLCNASPAADGVPPLLVLDAEVELASAEGRRRVPLAGFVTGPRRTVRGPHEIVTAIHIPRAALAGRSRFLKLGARRHLVISIAMVAVRAEVVDGRIARAALAVGACSAVARRLPGVEAALAGVPVTEAAARIAGADVAAALDAIDDIRATGAYRAGAAAELLRRALGEVVG